MKKIIVEDGSAHNLPTNNSMPTGFLSFQSFQYKILSFSTAGLSLSLNTGSFSQNQSQAPRNLTPGIVDEDFPALAPPKTPAITKLAVLTTVPPVAVLPQKVVTMKNLSSATLNNSAPGSVWNIRMEEEVVTTVNEALAVVGTSMGNKRPRVDTSSHNTTKGEKTPTPATIPRMIRILSTQGGLKGAVSQGAISETISVSGMSSRPVSPPPQQQAQMKKSKSALKRERREKERREVEEKECELQCEKDMEKERLRKMEEEVHAPVVGRMKKKGKKHTDGGIESPASPYPTEGKGESVQTPTTEKGNKTASITFNVAPELAKTSIGTTTTANKTTTQLLQEMSDINFATLEMFKPIVGLKWELHITADDLAQIKVHGSTTVAKLEKSGQQLQQSGMTEISLCGGGTVATHQLITPGGSVLMGLTQEQEMRFMKLEENRKREKGWGRYPATQKDWNVLSELLSKNVVPPEGKEDGRVKGKITLDDLEKRVMAARKETEGNEKKLEKLLKRNKRLVGLV